MNMHFMSEGERQYIEKRKAALATTAEWIDSKNSKLVGEVKTYKGVEYQMEPRGTYVCLNQPASSSLSGSFTSAFALHKIIDDLKTTSNPKETK